MLLVVVELCTLSVRIDKPDKANLVAVALFGDGAAAAVLRSGGDASRRAPVVRRAAERSWPGTLGLMGWDVDAAGLLGDLRPRHPALRRTACGAGDVRDA